jgi:hypothetical protein
MLRVAKARLSNRQLGLFVFRGTPYLKFSKKLASDGKCGFYEKAVKI